MYSDIKNSYIIDENELYMFASMICAMYNKKIMIQVNFNNRRLFIITDFI